MFNLSLYNDDFFKWHYDNVHESELQCGKILAKHYNLKSLVDFGCGIGSFLEGAYITGVEVKGFEISEAAKTYTNPSLDIEYLDITKHIKTKKYDCCLCIEVAEHIQEGWSRLLVGNLTNSSDRVIFTAAPLGQEGTGHINLQEPEFWIELFKERGMKLKDNEELNWKEAPDYVLKNLMIFEL